MEEEPGTVHYSRRHIRTGMGVPSYPSIARPTDIPIHAIMPQDSMDDQPKAERVCPGLDRKDPQRAALSLPEGSS